MKKLLVSLALGLLVFGVSNAQDTDAAQHAVSISIPEVFILDIEQAGGSETTATTVLDLTPDLPTVEAGEVVNFLKTDASLTLNYTSIVSSSETRNVTVGLDSDLPAGIELKVVASAIIGSSSVGATGTPVASGVTLASGALNLITGIGTGYTGEGNANGHQLTYTLSTDAGSFASLVATTTAIQRTVTYTITD